MALRRSAPPRSLDRSSPRGARASLADADRMKPRSSWDAGRIGPPTVDVFGRMRPEVFIGRVSDGVPRLARSSARRSRGRPARPRRRGGGRVSYCPISTGRAPATGSRSAPAWSASIGAPSASSTGCSIRPAGRPGDRPRPSPSRSTCNARRMIPIGDADQRAPGAAAIMPGLGAVAARRQGLSGHSVGTLHRQEVGARVRR